MADSRTPVTAAQLYNDLGRHYEDAFGHQPATTAALEHLLPLLPPRAKVADIGSGTGWPVAATVAAAGHEVTGYDVAGKMVELATARVPDARFELADMRSLQCEAGTWDAVLVFFSMLQLDRAEQDATITKLAQWLTPGGYLVFATVPGDADGVTIEWMGHLARVSTYPAAVLRHRLEAAGLRIVREDRTQFTPSDPLAGPEPQLYLTARKPLGD